MVLHRENQQQENQAVNLTTSLMVVMVWLLTLKRLSIISDLEKPDGADSPKPDGSGKPDGDKPSTGNPDGKIFNDNYILFYLSIDKLIEFHRTSYKRQ